VKSIGWLKARYSPFMHLTIRVSMDSTIGILEAESVFSHRCMLRRWSGDGDLTSTRRKCRVGVELASGREDIEGVH